MKRVLPVLGFVAITYSVLFWRGNVFAQDETITNVEQLAAAIDQSGLYFPLASVTESPLSWQALGVFWADFSQLTNAIGDVRNFDGETQYGVTVWRLRLTRTADEITFSYPATDTNLLQLAAAEDGFSNHYDRVLFTWCILGAFRNYESYEDLQADGYTFLDPKRLVLDITVADINDCSTYEANAGGGGMLMMMSEEVSGDDLAPEFGIDGDPCSITNLLQRFSFTAIQRNTNASTTVTWESCPIFRYIVLSADLLATNTIWQPQAYIWGQTNASATSWTDLSTTNSAMVTQRFYRVEKILASPIAAGTVDSFAVVSGRLWEWGLNSNGELGDGTCEERPSPEPGDAPACNESNLSNVVAVASGLLYSVAVDANGTVWSCGNNQWGQLGYVGQGVGNITPSPVTGVSNVVSVAAGFFHTLALRADGIVFAWGNDFNDGGNPCGQLGVGGLSGLGYTNSPVQTLVLTQIVAIAAGYQHSVALDQSGKVWTFGDNSGGQLGNGGFQSTNVPAMLAGISNVIAIAGGGYHTIAIRADKTLWTWGANDSSQLGRSGTNALPRQVVASGLSNNVVAIAGGYAFTMAVTTDGWVYAFGDNSYGELGMNSSVSSTGIPTRVAGISNVVWVSASSAGVNGDHSLAVAVNQGTNQYYGWGYNGDGEAGNGTSFDNIYAPALVQFTNTCAACAQLGTSNTFTAYATGTLTLWLNDNFFGDNGTGTFYTVTIDHGLGTVTVWATNGEGIVVGTVTNGVTYTCTASGYCDYSCGSGCKVDANGKDLDNNLVDCAHTGQPRCSGGFVCPSAICYSLVGKIQ